MKKQSSFAIIGAGFSGAVLANQLARHLDKKIIVFDERSHIGGNCYTKRDERTSIMEHCYGPHIFHTNSEKIWNYINHLSDFVPYTNRVKAVTPKGFFSLPINLTTINQFFGKTFHPNEAKAFIISLARNDIDSPKNFEEQALKFIGQELYENFFKGYTIKQWGVSPTELPASILTRLPIRFNCDDNYYNSIYQGIPVNGYTPIIKKLLDHPHIEVRLSTYFEQNATDEFDHVFNTGAIDRFYNNTFGGLSYRTVYFEKSEHDGDFQGNAVINYTSQNFPYTRISEHKHFAIHEYHAKTIIFREFSKFTENGDIPYYPMRLSNDMSILPKYLALAMKERKISFLGRLATYRYLDMHKVIEEALEFADDFLEAFTKKKNLPIFPRSFRT